MIRYLFIGAVIIVGLTVWQFGPGAGLHLIHHWGHDIHEVWVRDLQPWLNRISEPDKQAIG